MNDTETVGTYFDKGTGLDIKAYMASDYARNKNNWRSVTGSTILYDKSLVSWISRTQRCITSSTTEEAEYTVMADAVKDTLVVHDAFSFPVPGMVGNLLSPLRTVNKQLV